MPQESYLPHTWNSVWTPWKKGNSDVLVRNQTKILLSPGLNAYSLYCLCSHNTLFFYKLHTINNNVHVSHNRCAEQSTMSTHHTHTEFSSTHTDDRNLTFSVTINEGQHLVPILPQDCSTYQKSTKQKTTTTTTNTGAKAMYTRRKCYIKKSTTGEQPFMVQT